jgi:hypothetical protein
LYLWQLFLWQLYLRQLYRREPHRRLHLHCESERHHVLRGAAHRAKVQHRWWLLDGTPGQLRRHGHTDHREVRLDDTRQLRLDDTRQLRLDADR